MHTNTIVVEKRFVPYTREKIALGFMIILGIDKWLKLEAQKENYSKAVQEVYDNTHTYHDGKW